MTPAPALSIVIPTYKRTDSLQSLLHALLAQKGIVPEIIVVDQNPPGYLQDILRETPSIRHIVLHAPNVSEARNRGFLASAGEIILFVDDDLLPEDDFCMKALDVFRKYPDIGCFSPLVYSAEGRPAALQHANARYVRQLDKTSGIFAITDTITAAVFFRREYFERSGGFDPLLFEFAKAAEDQELFLRMRLKEMVLYFVPFIEIYHDETRPGGCDMRTVDYWVTREKCMRSWAYRYRIHHHPPGAISIMDHFRLAHSGFLNREVLLSGMKNISRQVKMLSTAIRASGEFLHKRLDRYSTVEKVSHLTR